MVHGHLVELLRLGEVLLEEVAEVVVRAERVHARVAPKRDADAVPREEHVFHRGVLVERLQHVVVSATAGSRPAVARRLVPAGCPKQQIAICCLGRLCL